MNSWAHVSWIRWALYVQLFLLAAQFEVGAWVVIFGDIPAIRMSGVSLTVFVNNVVSTGPGLIAHAGIGLAVFGNAVFVFLLSLRARIRRLRIASATMLVFVTAAGLGGLLFVLQGFAGDRSLFLMNTGFLAAAAASCYSLYLVLEGEGAAPVTRPPLTGA